MSEKKPGFFKRLLGSLLGTKEETPAPVPPPKQQPEPEPRQPQPAATKQPPRPAPPTSPPEAKEPEAKEPEAKKPAPAAQPKPAAGPKPPAKPVARESTKEAKPERAAPKPAAKRPAKAEAKPRPPAKAGPVKKAGSVKKPGAPKPAAEKPVPEPPVAEPAAAGKPAAQKPKPPAEEPARLAAPVRSKPRPRPVAEAPPPPTEAPPAVTAPPQAVSTPEEPPQKKGWFTRLRDGLSRTSNALTENITTIFTKRRLDEVTLQELEDALIQADLGVDMAVQIAEEVARGRYNKEISPEEVRAVLGAEIAGVLEPMATPLALDPAHRPNVILVVGVNGTGKTTTIGKLSHRFAREGRKVVMAAGDTFRAAAIEQLKIWGERTGAEVVARDIGADAAGLAYDALQRAREVRADALLIDTAGRLQNKADLMAELAKIVRVVKKLDETAPHAVLLILDATTGQNAVRQVEVFQEIAGVTGLIMTKLDGTARGGILVAIARRFALPIHAIGVGETVEDLQPFDAYEFAAAIAGAREKVEA